MNSLRRLLDSFPLWLVIALCLTLGLAPFVPEPHIWEKLKMLAAGMLSRPVDIFDLAMHALPWLLLFAKLLFMRRAVRRALDPVASCGLPLHLALQSR